MLIKWKSIYWPIGEWVNQSGENVNLTGNFYCKINNDLCACIMQSAFSPAGHGEPSITSTVPMFINNNTLQEVKYDGFISVDDEVISNGQM